MRQAVSEMGEVSLKILGLFSRDPLLEQDPPLRKGAVRPDGSSSVHSDRSDQSTDFLEAAILWGGTSSKPFSLIMRISSSGGRRNV